MKDFKTALRLSLPVLGAYWFLGITYGLLAASMGYGLWIPCVMATLIYSGSVEFIALTLLAGSFHPAAAAAMALMVGARHLFYGISMLRSYSGSGWKKPLLILWLTDETFAVNYSQQSTHTQQLWVSLLDYIYWLTGGIIGYLLGTSMGERLIACLHGLDFVVTAMFVAIFMDDYMRHRQTRSSAWLGIVSAAICLMLFGSSRFIVPAMACILLALFIKYKKNPS